MNASPARALREDALRKNDQRRTRLGLEARTPDMPQGAVARPAVQTPDLPRAVARPEALQARGPRGSAERRGVAGR